MKKSFSEALRLGGAFTASIIGSGFATGQETLQFFSSFGIKSYYIIAFELIGFFLMGCTLMTVGQKNLNTVGFEPFTYFCGKKIGTFYMILTPIILTLFLSVMLAGAGSTIHEYFGLNRYVGSAIVALAMFVSYLIGFERLVRIISVFGPCVIFFLLLVGILTVFKDGDRFAEASGNFHTLAAMQTAPSWPISALLYLSLNFMSSTPYFTQLGMSAKSKKLAVIGSIFGVLMLIGSVTLTNTAILLHADETGALEIPMLYLARKLHDYLGGAFSVILLLGIFSTSATMMWTICNQFSGRNEKRGKWVAGILTVGTYLLGMVSFGSLIATLYPIIGYLGLGFILCVIVKLIRNKKSGNT